jgi:predicted amidohydrolase
MGFRLALVQPIAHRIPNEADNVAEAVRHVEEAAARGADVVAFPETYPGPWRMPAAYDPGPALADAARRCGVYVQYGTLEPIDDAERTAYNILALVGPSGEPAATYRRTHPPGPWIYAGGRTWDFVYVAGNEFPVFETEHGVFGLAMCSEAYMPEVTRALALRGAEVILLPAGTDKQLLFDSWRNLLWSRAIENLAVVASTQNVYAPDERGLAMVATPEEVIFEATRAGMYLVDIDLDRIRQLRAENDQDNSSVRNRAKAGVLRQWQRPELYDEFYPRAGAGSSPRSVR